MVKSAVRREIVFHRQKVYDIGERRACKSTSFHRSSQRYKSRGDPQTELRIRLKDLAAKRDNRMSPSYSTKNAIRYRFYISAALLRGRNAEAGSLPRISAKELAEAVPGTIRTKCEKPDPAVFQDANLIEAIERTVLVKCEAFRHDYNTTQFNR